MQMRARRAWRRPGPPYERDFEAGVNACNKGSAAVEALRDPVVARISAEANAADHEHDAAVVDQLFPAARRGDRGAALRALARPTRRSTRSSPRRSRSTSTSWSGATQRSPRRARPRATPPVRAAGRAGGDHDRGRHLDLDRARHPPRRDRDPRPPRRTGRRVLRSLDRARRRGGRRPYRRGRVHDAGDRAIWAPTRSAGRRCGQRHPRKHRRVRRLYNACAPSCTRSSATCRPPQQVVAGSSQADGVDVGRVGPRGRRDRARDRRGRAGARAPGAADRVARGR